MCHGRTMISYILLLSNAIYVCCPLPSIIDRQSLSSSSSRHRPWLPDIGRSGEVASINEKRRSFRGGLLPQEQENDDQPVERKEYSLFSNKAMSDMSNDLWQMPLEQSLETKCAQSFVLGEKQNNSSARRSWIQRFEQECRDCDLRWVGQPH